MPDTNNLQVSHHIQVVVLLTIKLTIMTTLDAVKIIQDVQPKNWVITLTSNNVCGHIRRIWNGKGWTLSSSGINSDKILNAELDMVEINFKPENVNIAYGDYIAQILPTKDGFSLEEAFYPTENSEFGVGYSSPERSYNSEYQINIFGEFKTLGGAFRNLIKYGNSTHNHRKPKEIYV